MTNEKLKEIIDTKNGDLERVAVNKAKALIDSIAQQHESIAASHQRIQELREELRKMQVQTIDAASILGN
jgi:hypothetical protein